MAGIGRFLKVICIYLHAVHILDSAEKLGVGARNYALVDLGGKALTPKEIA